MTRITFTAVLAFALATFGADNAAAQTQTQTYMLIVGIPGESTDDRHKDWIEVLSLSQNTTADKSDNGACSVSLAKSLDRSGPLLWAAAVSGTNVGDVRIEITRGGEDRQRFYELTLTNAFVTSLSATPNSLLEQLTLAGDSARLRYFPQKADGTLDAPIVATVKCR